MTRWIWRDNRLSCTDKDLGALQGMAESCPSAAQILATGEIASGRVGEIQALEYMKVNEYVEDPLFIHTTRDTWKMTRKCHIGHVLSSAHYKRIAKAEKDRIGFKYFSAEFPYQDFYFHHLSMNNYFTQYAVVHDQATFFLLNGALLFLKPNYAEISFDGFMAHTNFRENIAFEPVGKDLRSVRNDAWNKEAPYLTNKELTTIMALYDQAENGVKNFSA